MVILDCLQRGLEIEFRQHNNTIPLIDTAVADENQAVDVAERKKTENVLSVV